MFFRLLFESFRRQRRRKLLAGIAILFGTTAVTAMLAVATTIGDRIHRELAVYGANIVVYPQADLLDVKVGGVNLKPATGGAYLHEGDLAKLRGIFWANNITGVSPELSFIRQIAKEFKSDKSSPVRFVGYWYDHEFGSLKTGAPSLHPWWKLQGSWPRNYSGGLFEASDAVVGSSLAKRMNLKIGDTLFSSPSPERFSLGLSSRTVVVGIVSTGDDTDNDIFLTLGDAQTYALGVQRKDAVSRIEVSARTKPEDAFARSDPDKLSPAKREIWYCRPYANSIAYQIQEAIPGSHAEQIRRVEQSEGNVLSQISGLMWLISAAALLAAGFAVSAAMATTILERRGEIGLMRSLGASRGTIALLFYSETGILAVLSGAIGYLIGSGLAAWLGARIFASEGAQSVLAAAVLNPVLLPIVVGMALLVAIGGSTPAIRNALAMDPSSILRADA